MVVLPAILVPALQAAHGSAPPLNAARVAALALCGGFGAAALALASEGGGLTPEQVLLAPGAATPSETVVIFALAATAGLAALRLPLFSEAATRWLRRPRSGTPLCVLMLAVSATVIAVSAAPTFAEIDGEWWQALSVVLAFPDAPLATAGCCARGGDWAEAVAATLAREGHINAGNSRKRSWASWGTIAYKIWYFSILAGQPVTTGFRG